MLNLCDELRKKLYLWSQEKFWPILEENKQLKEENKQLKDELKSKPDAQITLQDDKGNKFMVIQTERIDMQVELNKTIEKLFNKKTSIYLYSITLNTLEEIK